MTPFAVYSLLCLLALDARVSKGTRTFHVKFNGKPHEADQLNDVVSRIIAYCETLPGWNLSTSVTTTCHGRVVCIVEASSARVASQADDNESLPDRIFDGIDRSWDASLFLPEEGHFLVEITVKELNETDEPRTSDEDSTVFVSLDCYRHSSRGAKAVEKICSRMEGELSRTNRRWRRIFKRQAEQNKGQTAK